MSDLEARVQATAELLLAEARRRGLPVVGADSRLRERDAEVLVGYQSGGLRKARSLGTAPSFYRLPTAGSSLGYRVLDLARWIEARREDPRIAV